MIQKEGNIMGYRYETHLHTCQGSLCGRSTGAEHARFYKEAGYQGVIITDHFCGGIGTHHRVFVKIRVQKHIGRLDISAFLFLCRGEGSRFLLLLCLCFGFHCFHPPCSVRWLQYGQIGGGLCVMSCLADFSFFRR
jgi:hypothetical protein